MALSERAMIYFIVQFAIILVVNFIIYKDVDLFIDIIQHPSEILRNSSEASGRISKASNSEASDRTSNKWYWFNKIKGEWTTLNAEDNTTIEQEYKQHLSKTRIGQIVYHCFGNGWSAIVDFENMKTCCGSGRCKQIPDNHMEFVLKRV